MREGVKLNIEEKTEQNIKNIWNAISDYGRHVESYYTPSQIILGDVSEKFVRRLARDNAESKKELRALFRRSENWDEELDAIVLDVEWTHKPNYNEIDRIARNLLVYGNEKYERMSDENRRHLLNIITFFTSAKEFRKLYINDMNAIAPEAYKPGRKMSRIFKSVCDAVEVTDESPGSDFQRLYAKFSDEIKENKTKIKLFVSLNPAHFLTMSNPKEDDRGETMTSCHSFNYVDYEYNNGCSGYARDNYSFIVFTES